MHSHIAGPIPPPRTLPVPGQFVTVVRLREMGRKKRSPPEQGYLVLAEEWRTPEMPYRRARSSATLYRAQDPLMGGSPPLFDPEIMRWDERGVVLQGWEISDGTQYVQVWLVTLGPSGANSIPEPGMQ